jgi:hypothetical protein
MQKGSFLVKRSPDTLDGDSCFFVLHDPIKAEKSRLVLPGLFSLLYMFVSAY